MAHDHDHAHDNTYYLDQLCTVAACGALGGVAVMMYFGGRLRYILAEPFWIPVLVGGFALLGLVLVRAITLWREAGQAHTHDIGPDHDHDHHHHDHEHHHHDHASDHDHGHEHGWTPARYAVLMLPIVLYFLNLPNSTFSAETYSKQLPSGQMEVGVTPVAGKEGMVLGFKELSNAAAYPDTRAAMEGKTGRLVGMYSPLGSDKEFTLFRVKMTCCAADAIPVGVRIISEENITRIQAKQWVEAEGQIQFRKLVGQEKYMPVLYLKSADQVKPAAAQSDFGLD